MDLLTNENASGVAASVPLDPCSKKALNAFLKRAMYARCGETHTHVTIVGDDPKKEIGDESYRIVITRDFEAAEWIADVSLETFDGNIQEWYEVPESFARLVCCTWEEAKTLVHFHATLATREKRNLVPISEMIRHQAGASK